MTAQLMECARSKWAKVIGLLLAAIIAITLVPTNEAHATSLNCGPEKTTVPVVKIWNDCDDQDGIRPDSVKVMLFADGVYAKTLTLTEEGDWRSAFTGLPKYAEDGKRQIVYTVLEIVPEGYLPLITPAPAGGYFITNTHFPAQTEVSGTVTWDDADNQDGIRPDTITVSLLANDEVVASQEVSADADGNWSYTFSNLPKNDKGEEIVYNIDQAYVEGYTTTVYGYDLVNVHAPEMVSIGVTTIWNDDNNAAGNRPVSIVVNLLADGEVIGSQVVTAEDEWTCAFESLPKYRDGGVEIVYTITQDAVDGYTTEVAGSIENGFTVTNTLIPVEEPVVPGETVVPNEPAEDNEEPVVKEEKTTEEAVIAQTGDAAPFAFFGFAALASIAVAAMAWTKSSSRRLAYAKHARK